MVTVKCSRCGAPVDEMKDPPGGRLPCDECGSLERAISASITEGIQIGSHFAMLQKRADEVIGFAESVRDGLASFGFKEQDGSLRHGITGHPPQGEDDTHKVCSQLITRLNQAGADWSAPMPGTGDVDCEAKSESDPTRLLRI